MSSKGVRSLGYSVLSHDQRLLNQRSPGRVVSEASQGTTRELFFQASGIHSCITFGTREGVNFTSCVARGRPFSTSSTRERNVSSKLVSILSSRNLLWLPGMRFRGWPRDAISTLNPGKYSLTSARNSTNVPFARGRRGRPMSSENLRSMRIKSRRKSFSSLLSVSRSMPLVLVNVLFWLILLSPLRG